VLFSDKVILSTSEPFSDVLGMTDLLASFSSTTIEEALQNRVPVLLYWRGRTVPAYTGPGGAAGHGYKGNACLSCENSQYLAKALVKILSAKTDARQFDPYIYPKEERRPIAELLNI